MRRYADPERCPDCQASMSFGAAVCPRCGLVLTGPLAAELFTTLHHADELLAGMRAATTAAEAGAGVTPAAAAPAGLVAAGLAPEATREPTREAGDRGGLATLVRPEPPGPPAGGPPADLPHPGRGLSGASVPKILLALGALCLLVAALVFLAVAWSAMGVAGRTATLVGFTVVAGLLTGWAARHELRAAAESLAAVALGLAAFDLVGARDAGWLGDLTTSGFLVVAGSALAVLGTAAALAVRRTPVATLVTAELVSVAGVATALGGAVTTEGMPWSAAITGCVAVAAAVAFLTNRLGLTTMSIGGTVIALFSWTLLTVTAWDRALQSPSLSALWLDLEVWPLLVAAGFAAGLVLVGALPSRVRLTSVGVAALLLSTAVLAPVADESVTDRVLAAAALLTAVAALAVTLPQPWRRALAGPGAPLLAWVAVAGLGLAAEATARVLAAGSALWTGDAGDSFTGRADTSAAGWLLPVVVIVTAVSFVAAARSFAWADRAVAPLADVDVLVAVAAATATLTVALFAAPVWAVLAALLATAVLLVGRWLQRQHALPLALGAAFTALAVQLSLHAPVLTLGAVLVLLVVATAVYLRAERLEVSVAAGVVVSAALGGLVWTIGDLVSAVPVWTALATLAALAVLTLGGPYADRRLLVGELSGLARLGVEIGALATAFVVGAAGVDSAVAGRQASWLAVYLTVTGATVSAMALLRADRRWAAWLGGFLLAAASWVRLADLGVDAPEAYTLPSALALLAVGVYHLRRHPESGTAAALSPGLALALVPSLLWVLADPIALRSTLLGVTCLALVVGGVRMRWSAPLLHGAVVGAVLVVRLATPLAEAVPRWALIGAAGVLLVALGITWEARVRDARRVAGYVRGLR